MREINAKIGDFRLYCRLEKIVNVTYLQVRRAAQEHFQKYKTYPELESGGTVN